DDRAPPARKAGPAAALEPVPSSLPRKRRFVGREDEIVEVEAALGAHGSATLFGLAGSGKTALALAIAHRAVEKRTCPGGVIWLSAEGSAVDAIARLAPAMRAIGSAPARAAMSAIQPGASAAEIAAVVRLALQATRQASLLVLDGIDAAGWPSHLPGGEVRVL